MNKRAFDMNKFFNPASIAIIGASQDFTSIGGKPVRNLLNHQYKGKLYVVNPKYEEINGLKCYPSILDIEDQVDMALIATSHKIIKPIMEACGKKGVPYAILFGAGFAELGDEGKKLQDEVLKIASEYNIRLVGPNCVGSLNVINGIPMGFATSFEAESFIKGNIALASQSGAFGYSVFGLAQEEKVGFSYIANTGNQVDLTTLDFLEKMLNDPHTDVLATYLESIPDGEQFIDILEHAKEVQKPVIVLKSGRSELGKQAALSHTASIAGSNEVYDAVAKQYGAITVNDIDEMIDAMKIFSRKKLSHGSNIAVITTSGASGIMMADLCEANNINMAQLSHDTKEKIKNIIPTFGSALNPIDITLQALNNKHLLKDTINVLVESEDCDIVVISTTLGGELGERICKDIVEIDQQTDKPIIVNLTGRKDIVGKGLTVLQDAGIPVYETPTQTIRAITKLIQFSTWIDQKDDGTNQYQLKPLTNHENDVWTEEQVKPVLESLGIPVPKGVMVTGEEDIDQMADTLKFPVVMKVISPDILHKSDANAVKIGIHNLEEAKQAFQEILQNAKAYHPQALIRGVFMEEMIDLKDGVEMFIGIKNDDIFGPVVACGFGGIYVEVLKDVTLRRAPFGVSTAKEMIKELNGYEILSGARNQQEKDIDAFAEALSKISYLAANKENNIAELDINPFVVFDKGKGIVALDGILLQRKLGS